MAPILATACSRTPRRSRADGRRCGKLFPSLTGAQIEHVDLFRLGAACALDLPPPFGAPSLPAEVVWCTAVGRKVTRGGESHLVARSGLRFTALTVAQQAALGDTLQHVTAALQAIA